MDRRGVNETPEGSIGERIEAALNIAFTVPAENTPLRGSTGQAR